VWSSLSESYIISLWNQRHKCCSFASHDFVAISSPECTNCEYSEPPINDRLEFVLYEKEDMPKSTYKWLESLEHETHENCPHCFSAMMQLISFKSIPSMLVFEINSRS
jgi:hypothetical protein